jgi:NADH-quinone oxidoreductase subunit E
MSTANPNPKVIVTTRGEPYVLDPADRAAIEHAIHHYDDARAASIDALKIVQERHGWVPDGAISAIGEVLGIPGSDVDGVATFYNRIYRRPVGRHVISICDSIACHLTGYDELAAAFKQKLGIQFGQTTADGRFTLLPICCLGNCDKGPTLLIDEDTHGPVDVSQIAALLEQYS